jgi:hypothetical protein
MIGTAGEVLGIGSLQVPHQIRGNEVVPLNMVVPIELLPPIYDDLKRFGRVNRPARPWLGVYAAESDDGIVVVGFAGNGPARRAGLREGGLRLARLRGESQAHKSAAYARRREPPLLRSGGDSDLRGHFMSIEPGNTTMKGFNSCIVRTTGTYLNSVKQ